MTHKHTFTQALALRPWYKPTGDSKELLKELDKDLKKWDAHVSDESNQDHVCVVATATFDKMRYRFTLRVHAPVEIVPIDLNSLSLPLRAVLKTHLRARNVLKNFLPVVFDRLAAERQFHLVTMSGLGQGQTSHCIWATNTGGLGLSIVTVVEPEDSIIVALNDATCAHPEAAPAAPRQALPKQEPQSHASMVH